MRDKLYLFGFLIGAGLLLYVGRNEIRQSAILTTVLAFAGTTAVGVLGLELYRVQLALRTSQRELAMRQAELNFAREVQESLLPRQFPSGGGLEFSAVCVPARGISGDYYDVVKSMDGRMFMAIADISGKGLSAAILMSNLQAVLRTVVEEGGSPADICAKLNRHLYRISDGTRFATFFFCEWDQTSRLMSYVNAGHTTPILWGSSRACRLDLGGPPLGLFRSLNFQVGTHQLLPGDIIVLYSDGITEAGIQNGDEFGEERLTKIIDGHGDKPLAEIQEQILKSVRKWAANEPEDDMTLLLARATREPGE